MTKLMDQAQRDALAQLVDAAGVDQVLATLSSIAGVKLSRPQPKGVKPDYRTAAEIWAAGGTVKRAKRTKASGDPRSVIVKFADGRAIRVSTYLDGQAGLNEAGAFARSVLQTPLRTEKAKVGWGDSARTVQGVTVDQGGSWTRDGAGVWRLLNIQPVPELVSVEYAASEQREAA